jgi:hypothetical protein
MLSADRNFTKADDLSRDSESNDLASQYFRSKLMLSANRNFIKANDLSRNSESDDLASQYFWSKLMLSASRNFTKSDDLKPALTIFEFVSDLNVLSSERRPLSLKSRRHQKTRFSRFDLRNHDDRKL